MFLYGQWSREYYYNHKSWTLKWSSGKEFYVEHIIFINIICLFMGLSYRWMTCEQIISKEHNKLMAYGHQSDIC